MGVLEAVEKLPVYVHEGTGQVLNLQVCCVHVHVHACTCIYVHVHMYMYIHVCVHGITCVYM